MCCYTLIPTISYFSFFLCCDADISIMTNKKVNNVLIEQWLEDFDPENSDIDDQSDDDEIENFFESNADVLESNEFLENILDETVSI